MHLYLESTKAPGVRFEVTEYDKETKTATIRGEFGGEFTHVLSKAAMDSLGFKLVKSEKELPLTPPPPKAKGKVEEEAV